MTDARVEAAAKAAEELLATKGWALHAAASTVGIERGMTTPEIVAHWLASKLITAADASEESELARTRTALRQLAEAAQEVADLAPDPSFDPLFDLAVEKLQRVLVSDAPTPAKEDA